MSTRTTLLQPGGVGLRILSGNPHAGGLQWLERPGDVDVDHRVELIGRAYVEVVALSFGLRQVDHPDRTPESDHLKCPGGGEPSWVGT